MKPMNLFCLLLFFCAVSFILHRPSFVNNAMPWGEQEAERDAQEEETFDEKSAQEEMSSSIYGRITGIDLQGKVLALLPTDEVENEELEEDDDVTSADYRFKSNTPLTGIDSFKELSPGDYVTLEYYAFQDSNRITEIVFDKHGENENTPTEEGNTTAETNNAGVLTDNATGGTQEKNPEVLVG